MNTATDIDAIATTADETIQALVRYRSDGAGEGFRQYREAVATIASGKPVDPQTLSRVLQFSGNTTETLQEDVRRAVLIAQLKNADIEAVRINAECAKTSEEYRRLDAEYQATTKAWLEVSEELSLKIYRLQEPLKQHEAIRRELRNSEAPRPVSLTTNWGESSRHLSDERRRIQHPLPDPTGSPECTPGRVELWRKEEAARVARVAAIDRQVAVFRRAEELIRKMYLCPVTGLWDQSADANKCLELARQEIVDAEAAQFAAKRNAAIEAEQAEEAAEADTESEMEPPGRISDLVASLESSGV